MQTSEFASLAKKLQDSFAESVEKEGRHVSDYPKRGAGGGKKGGSFQQIN